MYYNAGQETPCRARKPSQSRATSPLLKRPGPTPLPRRSAASCARPAPSAASRAGSSPSSRAPPSATSRRSRAGRAIRRSPSSRRSRTRSTCRWSNSCRTRAGAAQRSAASTICSRACRRPSFRAIADLIEGRTTADLAADRAQRIALVGLRGAGKSTLGTMLAQRLGVPVHRARPPDRAGIRRAHFRPGRDRRAWRPSAATSAAVSNA